MDAVERARDAMRALRARTVDLVDQVDKAFALVDEAFAVLEGAAANLEAAVNHAQHLPLLPQPTLGTIMHAVISGECKCDYKPGLLGRWLPTAGSWACKECGRLIPKSRVTPRILEESPNGQEKRIEA